MMHSIYMVSTKPKSKKMVSTINSYTKALVHIYIYVYVYIYIYIYIYIYGRDPLVIFMLQVKAVLLISFKNSENITTLISMLKLIVNLKSIKRM